MTAPPVNPSHQISLDGARTVLDAALAQAGRMDLAFCITVADPAGEPVVTARMDGAPRLSAGIATNKAYSVAGFNGMPTDRWWDLVKDNGPLLHGLTLTPRLTIFGGGLPIVVDGEVVGAIGVSGGSAEQDTEVAAAGAGALG
ncbi:MAG: GlcG/HbpS family heme-binding protein [Acidimicrobiales bacterium]